MKKIYKYSLLLALLFHALPALPQTSYTGDYRFYNLNALKLDNNLLISFDIDLSALDVGKQMKIELTPVLTAKDKSRIHSFSPVIIVGKTRDKVLNRELGLGNYAYPVEPMDYIVKTNKNNKDVVSFQLALPFEEWMRESQLVMNEKITGCGGTSYNDKYTVIDRVLPPLFVPTYKPSYVVPEAEAVKQRSETYSAHLNYRVGRSELLRDFENNAEILHNADEIVREVKNDENLTFQTLKVTGYASPEGNYDSNMRLSKDRAYSFVRYLEQTHGLHSSMMAVDWKGEDWDGLRKAVADSHISDRDAVLRIIDENSDISQRKQRLQALNNGTTYRMLLNDYYPPLRRNDYTISYIARPFSVEEAKEVLKHKPQHLSLNEMYLVANTYPEDSQDFKEVFDIAVRLFPNDPVANLNAAAQEIENGAINQAIKRLQRIDMDIPESWNNLGIAYAQLGDFDKAKEYLMRAIEAGYDLAGYNLEQLENFLAN